MNVKFCLPYQRKKTQYFWNLAQQNLNITRIKPVNKQECECFNSTGDAGTVQHHVNVLVSRVFGRTNEAYGCPFALVVEEPHDINSDKILMVTGDRTLN